MDREFQTSFIPKKSLAEKRVTRKRSMGIFSFLAMILFFASLIAGGGVYIYKNILVKQVNEKSTSLSRAKAAFEPTLITELQKLDKRINASEEILSNHIVLSPLFNTLQDSTLKTIQFTDFDYSFNAENENKINVEMSGSAKSYTSIALQSDFLGNNKYIKNPIFSNLILDNKGNVLFSLSFSVDESFLLYESNFNEDI